MDSKDDHGQEPSNILLAFFFARCHLDNAMLLYLDSEDENIQQA